MRHSEPPLKFVQINTGFFGHSLQAFLFYGFDGFGGKAQSHPALALWPPNPLPLQVGFLQLVGAPVGVGNSKAVVGFFAGELTDAGHGNLLVVEARVRFTIVANLPGVAQSAG